MPRAGTVTSRLVDCDMTVLTLGGVDVLAYFTDAQLEITMEEIDVTAPQDSWKKREICQGDWRATCTKLMYLTEEFATLIIAGGSCIVSTDLGGNTFYGEGLMVGATISSGNPQNEQCTIVSAGASPTLSA